MAFEIEAKFYVAEAEAWRARLDAAGATLVRPRVREVNTIFEDATSTLAARGITLRVRQDEGARLTFKGPLQSSTNGLKQREEIEIALDDAERMVDVLTRLGFRRTLVYEKERTTYHMGACEVVLDETPLGVFTEIEGPPDDIRVQADALGLDWETRLVDGYRALFLRARARRRWWADNMTFAEMAGIDVVPADWMP